MLASRSTSVGGKSTNSSKLGNSVVSNKAKKDSFFIYAYKRLISLFSAIWGKTRKTMWIVSTGRNILTLGFILLILPFTFAYISEFQKEAAKIMGGNLLFIQLTTGLFDGMMNQ